MKLPPRSFRIFWDVHAWVGIIAALFLYVMFLTGAFALFYQELNAWAELSETHAARPQHAEGLPRLQPLFEQLVAEHDGIGKTRIAITREGESMVHAYVAHGDDFREFRYDPERERLEPPRSELGTFLYSLHYLGPIPNGVYLAGVASMALFLALVTGFLVYLKDILRQWLQFRPERVARTWSSDLHKVLGLFGLPFQLYYAWTGAVLCLAWVLVEPTFAAAVFGGDERAHSLAARGTEPEPPAATGRLRHQLPDLDRTVAHAQREVPGLEPTWIGVEHVGDEASSIGIYGKIPGVAFGTGFVRFQASDGKLLAKVAPSDATTLQTFEAWFFGLHYARFGGYGVRILYAWLALTTCAVILTGNLIWLERRDRLRIRLGNRILERITVGIGAGTPLAIAAMFAANRCLPHDMADRAGVEKAIFGIALVLGILLPWLARRAHPRALAYELGAATILFGYVLVLDLTSRPATVLGNPIHRGVAIGLVVLAALCGCTATQLLRRPSGAAARP